MYQAYLCTKKLEVKFSNIFADYLESVTLFQGILVHLNLLPVFGKGLHKMHVKRRTAYGASIMDLFLH